MKFRFFASIFVATTLGAFFVPQHFHAQGNSQRIEIVAKRFEFTPNDITLKRGTPVVLVLTSKDVPHGLKFKRLNLSIKVKKGATSEVAFIPTEVGDFVGQCAVFCGSGHGSMKMTLHVTE
jgi:cytochrome c oxidase subunit 2